MTSRTCKSTSLNDDNNRKPPSKPKTDINLNHLKSLQETSKAKKLKSLNDSLIKNEPELSAVIKYNFTSPTSSIGIASSLTTKAKKSIKGLVNHDYCSYCDEGGDLLNCDRCPASFHLLCVDPPLNLDQIPTGEFLCNRCHARAELHSKETNSQTGAPIEANMPIW